MTHQLDDLTFWKLRALCTETQRLLGIAQQAHAETQRLTGIAQQAHAAALVAEKKQNAYLAELAKSNQIDPATLTQYSLDDETLTLIVP